MRQSGDRHVLLPQGPPGDPHPPLQQKGQRRDAGGLRNHSANPEGTPIEAFDGIRAAVLADRSQFWKGLAESFFGANHGRDYAAALHTDVRAWLAS